MVNVSTTSSGETESVFARYLSPSQITSLLTCGEKFRLTRKLGVPERPMWASIGGNAVHKLTELRDLAKYEADHGTPTG